MKADVVDCCGILVVATAEGGAGASSEQTAVAVAARFFEEALATTNEETEANSNDDGEQVGDRSKAGGLHRLCGHRGVAQSGQRAGRGRRGDDCRRITEVERPAGRGVHATPTFGGRYATSGLIAARRSHP